MGEPAELSTANRNEAHELADLIWDQITNDEAVPIINENRAWILAGEIRLLREETEDARIAELTFENGELKRQIANGEAAWRETCAAVDARHAELDREVSHLHERNRVLLREKAELLGANEKLQSDIAEVRRDIEAWKGTSHAGE